MNRAALIKIILLLLFFTTKAYSFTRDDFGSHANKLKSPMAGLKRDTTLTLNFKPQEKAKFVH
jgi:hypothetical protein